MCVIYMLECAVPVLSLNAPEQHHMHAVMAFDHGCDGTLDAWHTMLKFKTALVRSVHELNRRRT